MIAAVSPNPSIDKTFLVERVRPGEIHRPDELVVTAGGKGLNVARAAHALGGDVVAVALLAGHAGRWIAEWLRDAGVPADLAWAGGETRTSLTVADPASGRPTEFYERGDVVARTAWDGFLARVAARASAARWLSVSGSMPEGIAPAQAGAIVERARRAGARVAIDQHGLSLQAGLAAAPDLVKVNASEAAELTGEAEPRAAAAALHARLDERRAAADLDRAAAIVTAGEDGAYLVAPDGGVWHGRVAARGPFPTGGGDSFLAGLLVALDAAGAGAGAGAWRTALPLALGTAAANAECTGAGRVVPARARELAEQARVEPA